MGNYISGNESQYQDLYSVHLSMSYLIDRCIVRFKLLDILLFYLSILSFNKRNAACHVAAQVMPHAQLFPVKAEEFRTQKL